MQLEKYNLENLSRLNDEFVTLIDRLYGIKSELFSLGEFEFSNVLQLTIDSLNENRMKTLQENIKVIDNTNDQLTKINELLTLVGVGK